MSSKYPGAYSSFATERRLAQLCQSRPRGSYTTANRVMASKLSRCVRSAPRVRKRQGGSPSRLRTFEAVEDCPSLSVGPSAVGTFNRLAC